MGILQSPMKPLQIDGLSALIDSNVLAYPKIAAVFFNVIRYLLHGAANVTDHVKLVFKHTLRFSFSSTRLALTVCRLANRIIKNKCNMHLKHWRKLQPSNKHPCMITINVQRGKFYDLQRQTRQLAFLAPSTLTLPYGYSLDEGALLNESLPDCNQIINLATIVMFNRFNVEYNNKTLVVDVYINYIHIHGGGTFYFKCINGDLCAYINTTTPVLKIDLGTPDAIVRTIQHIISLCDRMYDDIYQDNPISKRQCIMNSDIAGYDLCIH